MKILVVGGGGREHALIWKLAQSPRVTELICAPGNGGIATLAECVPVAADDLPGMVRLAQARQVDLVVVAPDDPLALGMVDALAQVGIRAFGPRQNAALLESSKAFSKDLMKKYDIPTAKYTVCASLEEALTALISFSLPVVIKADGLALGKGVYICHSAQDAEQALREIMEQGKFGVAGERVVIEEFMEGPEVSLLAFCDGNTLRPMVSAQDHKRAYDHDQGPNTGGMGAFAASPLMTQALLNELEHTVLQPTVDAMKAEGRPFQGVIYFGLMLTADGPKVLEYNARFGDPETQVVLPLMQSDLLDAMEACIDGTLADCELRFSSQAACCVVMASGGYPGAYEKGQPIEGLDALADAKDIMVFHAGTARQADGTLVTHGGRVLGVTAVADTLEEAISRAYAAVERIHFEHAHYRHDIGRKNPLEQA